jgi:cysteine desulfurase
MESARLLRQRQQFLNTLEANIECITLNGHKDQRVAGNLNISFKGVEGESLIMALGNLAVSSGSACTSESLEPSYVLQALGVGDESHTSLRIGLGRFTTDDDVKKAADTIIQAVQRLRDLSPLWDMYKAGIDLNTIQWSHH